MRACIVSPIQSAKNYEAGLKSIGPYLKRGVYLLVFLFFWERKWWKRCFFRRGFLHTIPVYLQAIYKG